MTSICFVVPAYRRFELTALCLRALVDTCTKLEARGIAATAVVVADDANLDVAELVGFGSIERANRPLGRKFNDGLEYATRVLGVDYVMPMGSDNWISPDLVEKQIPTYDDEVGAHRLCTVIREDGQRAASLRIAYDGGDGVRTIPSSLIARCGYRPADDDKNRAIDTSIFNRLRRAYGRVRFRYVDVDEFSLIGFQSYDEQLNAYELLVADPRFDAREIAPPWGELRERFDETLVDDARALLESRAGVPA